MPGIIKSLNKHHKSTSLFGEKKQRPRFDILGRKKQTAARTTGKAEGFSKRRGTLWQEYWNQKKESSFVDNSAATTTTSEATNDTRKRKRQDDAPPDNRNKRVRHTGLAGVTYEDNKQTQLQDILSKSREMKRSNQIQRMETMDEIDQVDAMFNAQRGFFFAQKNIVQPDPVEMARYEEYDKLLRDLVDDSRVVPARTKNLSRTELEIAREKFKSEESERFDKFQMGEEYLSEESDDEFDGESGDEEEAGEYIEELDGEFDGEDNDDSLFNGGRVLISREAIDEDDGEGSDNEDDDAEGSEDGEDIEEEEEEEEEKASNRLNKTDESISESASEDSRSENESSDDDIGFLVEAVPEGENESDYDSGDDIVIEGIENRRPMSDDDDDNVEYEGELSADGSSVDEDFQAGEDSESEASEDAIAMMSLQDESLNESTSNTQDTEYDGESSDDLHDTSVAMVDMGDFADIEDPSEELEETTLNNELIQLYILKGKNQLLNKLNQVTNTSVLVHGIEDAATKMVELVRYIAISDKSDISLLKQIIEKIGIFGLSKPKNINTAFKNDIEIMFGKIEPGSGYPTAGDLLVAKAILSLYSTKGSGNITQMLFLYLCKHLSESEITSQADLISGLFICDLCLNYYDGYIPEVTNFLFNLTSLINGDFKKNEKKNLDASDISEDFILTPIPPAHPRIPTLKTYRQDWIYVSKKEAKPYKKMVVPELSISEDLCSLTPKESAEWKISFQVTLAALLRLTIMKHKSLPSFNEIYEPLLDIFGRLKVNHRFTLKQFRDIASELQDAMEKCVSDRFPLTHLRTAKKKMSEYEPRFQEDGLRGQFLGTESEQQTRVLKNKVKRMKRQAVRELRADNEFLRHVHEVEDGRKSYEAKLKYKNLMTELERERADPIQYDFTIADREKKFSEIRKNQRKEKHKRHKTQF